jgi:hypothetical protein
VSPPNKVNELPPEILAEAQKLLREGRTIDEITSKLQELGVNVSRSGVGRWKKSAAKSMRSMQRAQAFGAEWAKSLKEDPEGKVGRLLIEMGKTAVLDKLINAQDDGKDGGETDPLDAKSLFMLASAVKNFESAGNMNIAREIKIKETIYKEAAEAAVGVVKQQGLTPEAVEEIRAKILGIGQQ